MLHKAIVGKNYGLGKAIHILYNFYNNTALVKKRGRIIFFHDGVGDVLSRDEYLFIAVEGCVKIYIFEIVSHKSGTGF